MKRRVIISKLPQAQSGLETKMRNLRAGLGFNANTMPWPVMAGKLSAPDIEVNETLQPVAREGANLEAEKDEIAVVPEADKSGIPSTYKIGGKRHYQGGTPLNLPNDSFIFSDTARMRIKDPVMLAQFGMPFKKGGYTPAEVAKKYNVNPYKKTLADPDTDQRQKDTAELMISNYNLKLAKLALLQESMKGFPQGIPAIAMPYIEQMQIDPQEFLQNTPGAGEDQSATADNMAYGGMLKRAQEGQNVQGNPPPKRIVAKEVEGFYPGFLPSNQSITSGSDYPRLTSPTGDLNDLYSMYKIAMNTTNIKDLKDYKNKIIQGKERTGFWNWGALPWTTSDKLDDFAGHIQQRIDKLEAKQGLQERRKSLANNERDYRYKLSLTETALKKQYDAETDPVAKSDIAAKIQKLNKLKPENRSQYLKSTNPHYEELQTNYGYDWSNIPGTLYNWLETASGAVDKYINDPMLAAATNLVNAFTDDVVTSRITPFGYSPQEIQDLESFYTDYGLKEQEKQAQEAAVKQPQKQEVTKTVPKTEVKKTVPAAETKSKETTKPAVAQQKQPAKKSDPFANIFMQKTPGKKEGGEIGLRKVRIKSLGTYAEGGLVKAKHGIAGIPEVGDERNGKKVIRVGVNASNDITLVYDDNTHEIIPDSSKLIESKKSEYINTPPVATVDQKQYDELVAAYKKAEAAHKRNPKAKEGHPEVLEFQRLYHKYLPDVARNILATYGKPTKKGEGEFTVLFDTDANEDKYFGPRTVQYFEALQKLKPAEAKQEAKPGAAPAEGKTTTEGDTGAAYDPRLYAGTLNVPRQGVRPFIPVQNMLDIGRSFGSLMSRKRYYPWEPMINVGRPTATYYDPRGELDAQRAAMATLASGAGAFRGAQPYRAAMSQMAGQGFRGAADTLGRYNNMNVGIANALSDKLASADTQQSLYDAQRLKRLYEGTVATNALSDRERNMGMDRLVNSINAGITAGANIYNLNTMFPQYAVNPFGMVYGHDFKDIKPSYKTPKDYAEEYANLLKHPALKEKPDVALKILESSMANDNPTSMFDAYTKYKGNKGVTPYYAGAPQSYATHPSQYYENT